MDFIVVWFGWGCMGMGGGLVRLGYYLFCIESDVGGSSSSKSVSVESIVFWFWVLSRWLWVGGGFGCLGGGCVGVVEGGLVVVVVVGW